MSEKPYSYRVVYGDGGKVIEPVGVPVKMSIDWGTEDFSIGISNIPIDIAIDELSDETCPEFMTELKKL